MLDRIQLIQKLDEVADNLFFDDGRASDRVQAVWKQLCEDPLLAHKLKTAQVSWSLPSWKGRLDATYDIVRPQTGYSLLSIDGSQIYPDRHYGVSCYLVNVGQVILRYGDHQKEQKPVVLSSVPYVFTGYEDEEEIELSTEFVNGKRQDLELYHGVEAARALEDDKQKTLLLFDGSLIFWHLEAKDLLLKERFLSRYLSHLMALYKNRTLVASYISLPKSRELLNIVRSYLCNFDERHYTKDAAIDRIIDAVLVRSYVRQGQRTTVFKNHARVSEQYPDVVHPYFFYMQGGTEIGRVEIPAWIAQDEQCINQVASYVYDQTVKGGGYPVGLAEAHEQAVVKGVDREFFYHLLTKMSIERQRGVVYSQKAQRKRTIGV